MIQRTKAFAPPAGITPPASSEKPIKRAPAILYQKPAATGPGADSCRAVIKRAGEVVLVLKRDVAPELPRLAEQMTSAARGVLTLANRQVMVLREFQAAGAAITEQNKRLAYAAAREMLAQSPFVTPADRKRAEEGQADKMLADEQQRVLHAITEARDGEDKRLINSCRDAILESETELERAEFAHEMDVDTSVDAAFMQRAEALRQKMLSQKYFEQAGYALRLLKHARRLGDEARTQLIVYALRPKMIEMVSEGVIARRRAVAQGAGRPMAASEDLAAATSFVTISDQVAGTGSEPIRVARECLRQVTQLFMRTGGRDLADPASVTSGKFGSILASQKSMKLDEPLMVGDDWLTRAIRTKAYRPLPPWSENVAIAVRAGKAAS